MTRNKNTPASVSSTGGGRVERIKTGVSDPTITENGEVVNMNGLPERIKVTISRMDGSPVFSREETPQTLCLDEVAPILVVVRDCGTLRTFQGGSQEAFRFQGNQFSRI